jgi:membrane associated rhomboid family serine protease
LLPIKDLNRSSTTPHVNRILLIVNIVVFAVFWLSFSNIVLNQKFAEYMVGTPENPGAFMMVPADIISYQKLYTLFTSMFMHDPSSFEAGLVHLFGNMLFLYIFGDNVEDAFGHVSYFFLYIFFGLAAAFTYIASVLYLTYPPDLTTNVVGASGAISGVLGAYAVLYPKAKILTWVFYIILPVPAIIFLGVWFFLQWLYVVLNISSGVAYWAHIGGFIAGVILALTVGLKRKKAREARLRL